MRLKLAAPALKEPGRRPEIRCANITFVIIDVGRRSLSAIR